MAAKGRDVMRALQRELDALCCWSVLEHDYEAWEVAASLRQRAVEWEERSHRPRAVLLDLVRELLAELRK